MEPFIIFLFIVAVVDIVAGIASQFIKSEAHNSKQSPEKAEKYKIEDIRFSQSQTFGDHLYRKEGQIAEIVFENTKTRIRKVIVDNSGLIVGYPDVAHPDLISLYYKGNLDGRIRYSSHITLLDGLYALIWQIQPDGRYWEDEDGFGGTTDDEIKLYAHLDAAGNFIEPFRIFSIGSSRLYGTDEEESIARTLALKDEPLSSLKQHIPEMLDVMRAKIKIPEVGSSCYCIPGTIYQAELSLNTELGKWFVRVSMSKIKSDTTLNGWLKFYPLDEQKEYLKTKQAEEDAEKELTQLFYAIQRWT